ncbi:MAG: hypothetical protein ABI721_05750 [Candidatus Dojkabacteria bacterium]
MRKIPKIVNKLPIYLVLILVCGFVFFILTGKFKLEVVNVSANSSEVTNYLKLSTLDGQSLNNILTAQKTIGFVSSSYCSNCDVVTITLKDFLSKNPDYKVYEFDLDSSRSALRDIGVETAPSLLTKNTSQLEIRQNISVQDLKDILLTEFSI